MHSSKVRTTQPLPYEVPLSRGLCSGVSVQEDSVQGGHCPGGLCPGVEVSVRETPQEENWTRDIDPQKEHRTRQLDRK